MKGILSLLGALLLLAPVVRPDEIHLKDGSKIVGTIIGFEEDSFKVKTSYGYALVRRDEVVNVIVGESPKKPAPEAKAAPEKKTAAEKPAAPAVAATPKPAPADPPKAAKADAAVPETKQPAAATPTAAAAPPPPPKPASDSIREQVAGNQYTNETYGFRMYKPPDWQLIEGARNVLPGAIAALGTSDEATYLMIGQEPAHGTFEENLVSVERRLREIMDNFRPLGDKRVTISGTQAVQRRFRGTVDNHDWSGVVVLLPRGDRLYTIFGMTYAETDLVQIQENVISRTISSLEFTKQ
ncbi:MAG: hypothetical protein WBC04_07910 [Candidatus Acidiferrales bacterium]